MDLVKLGIFHLELGEKTYFLPLGLGQNFGPKKRQTTALLWYSYRFMYSFSQLHLPTLTSQTTIVSEKSIVLPFSPYKSIMDQIWPCRKIGQGQPRIIIWANLVVLEYPMLHTNFQGHRSAFWFQRRFLRFLPYMGMAAILVMSPWLFEKNFFPPIHGGSIRNLASTGPVASEMFENVDDGQRRLPIL